MTVFDWQVTLLLSYKPLKSPSRRTDRISQASIELFSLGNTAKKCMSVYCVYVITRSRGC